MKLYAQVQTDADSMNIQDQIEYYNKLLDSYSRDMANYERIIDSISEDLDKYEEKYGQHGDEWYNLNYDLDDYIESYEYASAQYDNMLDKLEELEKSL